MKKMLFTSPQPEVTIRILPDGKRDVTVLADEEILGENQEELQEEIPTEEPKGEDQAEETLEEPQPKESTTYQYTGNQFRTVYDLTEEDVLANKEKYLDYTTKEEPTLEQLRHDNEIIDSYTLELLEGGLL